AGTEWLCCRDDDFCRRLSASGYLSPCDHHSCDFVHCGDGRLHFACCGKFADGPDKERSLSTPGVGQMVRKAGYGNVDCSDNNNWNSALVAFGYDYGKPEGNDGLMNLNRKIVNLKS